MELKFCLCLLLIAYANNVCYGKPDVTSTDPLRSPLFPLVVQDFVADVVSRVSQDLPSVFTVPKGSPEEIFSVYYDEVYKSNVKGGDPNPKFHALCKAQSIKENYDKVDAKFLITVSSYTAGELLLQKGVLTAGNQKSLSNALAEDFVNNSKYVFPTFENYIRSFHAGYVNFLNSQQLATSTNIFVPAAVYVEVINALSKNYQIPFDRHISQQEVYDNDFNIFTPKQEDMFRRDDEITGRIFDN